ncbi:MAG: triose-phosphate isomerase [Solirubrobacterales bacterium]
MTRVPVIAANWKMHKGPSETRQFLEAFLPDLAGGGQSPEVVICPPFVSLEAALSACEGSPVEVAAQNMHFEVEGAYTGEVSAPMLVELGVEGVVLGHSERRQDFGETDEALARKLVTAVSAGLTPILCVGETEEERRADETEAVLSRQVLTDLAELHDEQLGGVVIAYEPIWAIGTGLTASVDQAEEAAATIRELVRTRDDDAAGKVRILYGGSVKPENAAELLAPADVDGALVGGASLSPDDFAAIVAAAPTS